MLPLDPRDPLLDNPFIRLGLSVALLRKLSFEQSRELASAFGRFLKKDIFPATNRLKHQQIDSALIDLNDEPFARAAHQYLGQLRDSDALLQKLEEAKSKREACVQKIVSAACLYELEKSSPGTGTKRIPSLPAKLTLYDVIAIQQPLLRKLLAKRRTMPRRMVVWQEDGSIQDLGPLPNGFPTSRELIGFLHVQVDRQPRKPIDAAAEFLRLLETLQLINSPARSLTAEIEQGTPSPSPVYPHFLPSTALERLLHFECEQFAGQLRAVTPQPPRNGWSVLVTRAKFGKTFTICLEGIVENLEPGARAPHSRHSRQTADRRTSTATAAPSASSELAKSRGKSKQSGSQIRANQPRKRR